MNNLRLIPGFHEQEAVVKVVFTYDNELISLVKSQKGSLLPHVLSKEDVYGLLSKIKNLKHRCILSFIYSTGLRRSELINLKIQDIDSSWNLVKIKGGKGNKDRQSILSKKLLENLREYFITYQPKKWLFEGLKGKTI